MSLNSNEPRSWDFTSGYNEKKKWLKKTLTWSFQFIVHVWVKFQNLGDSCPRFELSETIIFLRVIVCGKKRIMTHQRP